MKTCIVSGASGDIGLAICEALLTKGEKVIALYHNNSAELSKLQAIHAYLHLYQVDLLDTESTTSCLNEILQTHKEIQAFVACAGKTIRKPAMFVSEQEEKELLRLNYLSAAQIAKKILRPMVRANKGAIVFIGSRAGTIGLEGQAAYAASKGALASYAMSLAQEVGSKGITVNVIAPGAIKNIVNQVYSDEEDKAICERIALRRLAEPAEIASVAVFLTSDQAKYVTGTVIAADGGGRF